MEKVQILHKCWSLLCVLFLSIATLSAQPTYSLQIKVVDQPEVLEKEGFKPKEQYSNKRAVQKELQKLLIRLQGKSYLTASIDTLTLTDTIYTAHLYIGTTFQWANLTNGNVNPAFLSQVGFREKLYTKKPFSYQDIQKLQLDLLTYAENNGYPFASVYLGDVEITENGSIRAKIYMIKNKLIRIKALIIDGEEPPVNVNYLANYLGIKEGELYNESKIANIRNRLRELAFLREKRGLAVVFVENQATITLFLEKKRASRFDFLLGFLPKNEETGRLTLTGSLQAEMQNPFGTGKVIGINWQQLRPETAELKMKFIYPYILQLPFGLDTKFEIYRRDTTYRDVKSDIGVQYLFEGNNYLKAFWNNVSSTLLSINETQVIQSRRLPSFLDVSNATFGLEYNFEKLDYRLNPQQGIAILLRGGAGIKRINKNNLIIELTDDANPDFDFESLYDPLNLSTFQFRIESKLDKYWGFGSRNTILTRLQTGLITTQDSLYQNEIFRIGGARLLRGFDEESIFASIYGVFTLEYRFIIAQNSFLYGFLDYGYYTNQSAGIRKTDQPYGFGGGFSFDTGSGIVGIGVAVGSQNGNAVDFRASKIHIGYVNYF